MRKMLYYLLGAIVFIATMCTTIDNNPAHYSTIDSLYSMEEMQSLKLDRPPESKFFNLSSKETVTVPESVSTNALDNFKSFVSDYDAMCHNAKQLSLSTEHYIVSDDLRKDVSKFSSTTLGEKGHIINLTANYTTEIWYDKDVNDYYLYCKDSKDNECGWLKIKLNDLNDELYYFVQNQFNSYYTTETIKDVLNSIDLSNCTKSSFNGCCMLSAPATLETLEILQPAFLENGTVQNAYVRFYRTGNDCIVKVFYNYADAIVEQEVYSFKLVLSRQKDSFNFTEYYSNGDVPIVTLDDFTSYYENFIKQKRDN